jgi:hypothetical protein
VEQPESLRIQVGTKDEEVKSKKVKVKVESKKACLP